MSILGIDHVVIIGDDLEHLIERYRSLGFTVTPGGSHPDTFTHNALIPFQDGTYIELLAFQGSERKGRRAELLARGGGLIEYMLTSNAIEIDLANARRHRLPYAKPIPGSRLRPDGLEVAWLDGPVTDIGSGLPLLIQDVTSRSSRVPSGEARQHANGATGIARLVIAVTSIDNATLLYQHLLDDDAETARIDREYIEAVFLVGSQRIVLRQPVNFGPLDQHIKQFGDGPYALELLGPVARDFDPTAAGARISIAGANTATDEPG